MRALYFAFLSVFTAPFLVHELFHLLDYFVWGLRQEPSIALSLLFPFFDETPLGLSVHTAVFLAVMILIGLLWVRGPKR